MIQLQGFALLAGGLLLGVALFRANVLARWATVVLAVSGLGTLVTEYPDGAPAAAFPFPQRN